MNVRLLRIIVCARMWTCARMHTRVRKDAKLLLRNPESRFRHPAKKRRHEVGLSRKKRSDACRAESEKHVKRKRGRNRASCKFTKGSTTGVGEGAQSARTAEEFAP
eukprot:6174793-Pleurochrysis_carterae.AAC.2